MDSHLVLKLNEKLFFSLNRKPCSVSEWKAIQKLPCSPHTKYRCALSQFLMKDIELLPCENLHEGLCKDSALE